MCAFKGLAGDTCRLEGNGAIPEPPGLVPSLMQSVRLIQLGLSMGRTIGSKKMNRTPLFSDRTVLNTAYRKMSAKYCGVTQSVMESDSNRLFLNGELGGELSHQKEKSTDQS